MDEPWHLNARHIKPWRDASDAERLDGANGLLLAPHIDHLFDEGCITFSSSQELFEKSFDGLMAAIAKKREKAKGA